MWLILFIGHNLVTKLIWLKYLRYPWFTAFMYSKWCRVLSINHGSFWALMNFRWFHILMILEILYCIATGLKYFEGNWWMFGSFRWYIPISPKNPSRKCTCEQQWKIHTRQNMLYQYLEFFWGEPFLYLPARCVSWNFLKIHGSFGKKNMSLCLFLHQNTNIKIIAS